jgi:hypothetical protein
MSDLTTEFHHDLEEKVERDLRLDLFRGAGLWMIFLDHIPHDAIGWITLRNYGFSDAAEVFVFVSGYLAGFIYGPVIRAGQFLAATKRLWARAGQMYVAHLVLFLVFTAQIARTARKLDNPMYENEFNVFNFLQHPDILIGQALTLRYKPVDLDVLPLFIVLVLFSPFVIWSLTRRPNLALASSACLYVLARWFDWNIASYPAGTTWYFNPFCWQLLFVFGQWCGVGEGQKLWTVIRSRTANGGCRTMARFLVRDRHDLALSLVGSLCSAVADAGDVSDRQDGPRHVPSDAFPRARTLGGSRHAARLERSSSPATSAADAERRAFPTSLLSRRDAVFLRALGFDSVQRLGRRAVRRQRYGDHDHGGGGSCTATRGRDSGPVRRRCR